MRSKSSILSTLVPSESGLVSLQNAYQNLSAATCHPSLTGSLFGCRAGSLFDCHFQTDRYTERELENGLVEHLTRFLLELGAGFAYVGRQYRLEVDGEEFLGDAAGVNANLAARSGHRITHQSCNAHARRGFVKAQSNDPVLASQMVAFFQQLYAVEYRRALLSVAEPTASVRRSSHLAAHGEMARTPD